MTGSWGPFRPGLEPGERMARLRSLRTAVRLLAGPRGIEVGHRLLTAEISRGDPDALAEAEAEFDRLPAIDRRRILASFGAVQGPEPATGKRVAKLAT